jgi:integrase
MYCKNFGLDSPTARELASIHVAEKRKEILLGKFGYATNKLIRKDFREVAHIYFDLWSKELDTNGIRKHTERAVRGVRGFLDYSLLPFFGRMSFEGIRPLDVQRWRDHRVKTILGTSINREQAVLSSLFSHIETWVKTERIEAFELPKDPETGAVWNPAHYVKFAKTRKRERVLSTQELKALKAGCLARNDPALWDICKLALRSLLRVKDLLRIESGQAIDMIQAKTGVRVNLPVSVVQTYDYTDFVGRWRRARAASGLLDVQFRDLRKTGANLAKLQGHSQKLISEYLGHTNERTTDVYMVRDNKHLQPLADSLDKIVEGL